MNRCSSSFVVSAVLILLLASCDKQSYTSSSVDNLLKEAREANSRKDRENAEMKYQAAVTAAEETKGVPQMKAINQLSAFYREQGKSEKCRDLFLKAKEIGDQLLEKNSAIEKVPEFQLEYLTTIFGLANWERDMGHFTTALRFYEISGSWSRKLGALSPIQNSLDAERQKCIDEQSTQEEVERMLVSGQKNSRQSSEKAALRQDFSVRLRDLINAYPTSDPTKTERLLVVMADEAKNRWGSEEPLYAVTLVALNDVVGRTGHYEVMENVINKDIESMSAVDKKTSSGEHASPAEVVELGNFIDALLRKARLSLEMLDVKSADQQALRAMSLTEEYYPESHVKLESCWQLLAAILMAQGKYSEACRLTRQSINLLEKHDRNSSNLHYQFYDLARGYNQEGQLLKAVEVAEQVANRSSSVEQLRIAYQLESWRCLFDTMLAIGDYSSAKQLHEKITQLVNQRPRLMNTWFLALLYQEYRLVCDQEKFSELLAKRENALADKIHYYCQWVADNDLLSYAAWRLHRDDKAQMYLKNVEACSKPMVTKNKFLSKIVRVAINAKTSDKKVVNSSISELIACLSRLGHPERLMAVKPLTALGNYLAERGLSQEAEKVYSCALSPYTDVPGRVDDPLIQVLSGYHNLLVKQKRTDEAWQINARLEQKREKFATLILVTKEAVKKAKLL